MHRKTANKIVSLVLSFVLLVSQTGMAQAATQLNIAAYLGPLHYSPADKLRLPQMRFFSYDNLTNNFRISLDKGDLKQIEEPQAKEAARKALAYFLIGISLPDDAFWVNLRPDSPDNMIDGYLAQTDVGKILLEADLELKKDTARFTSPQTAEGKMYWDKLYQKAAELFGTENITIPTLTRPWIVPGEVIVRESSDSAYIYKAGLKVLLEQDYLKDSTVYNFSDPRLKTLNEYSSGLIRQFIIPKLTKEVNNSQRYAGLRQVYYSLILARWFKARFYGKGGAYAWAIDKKNLSGLTSLEPWSKLSYFQTYQKSFKQGEYNLQEQVSTSSGQSIRSYFSGGVFLGAKELNIGIPGQNSSPVAGFFGKSPIIGKGMVSFSGNAGDLNSLLPQLEPETEAISSPVPPVWQDIAELKQLFVFDRNGLANMVTATGDEMERGLSGLPGSLKMLPTYVGNPTGKEKGRFIGLDLGGSNFRVLMVRLDGNGAAPVIENIETFRLENGHISESGEVLFDAIADFINGFLKKYNYSDNYNLGYTFSFPVQQTNIDKGELITWTKGFSASGVVGEDIVRLLKEALSRKKVANVKVVSLDNDTTGTQVALAYTDTNCDIGGIIGTGTNFCYLENTSEIKKPVDGYAARKMIINMESGNFNRGLPITQYDVILDKQSDNPGKQLEEKMTSGKYLGELTRIILLDLISKGLLFNGMVQEALKIKDSFSTEYMSVIEADDLVDLPVAREKLVELGITGISIQDARIIKEVCAAVSTRAASISAGIIAAIIKKIDPEFLKPHSVAIDGSVFGKYPHFKENMQDALMNLFGEKGRQVKLVLTGDGSGIGAAIIAAVASNASSPLAVAVRQPIEVGETLAKHFLNSTENETGRRKVVLQMFTKIFEAQPQYLAVAPGRDNHQGEHVDYSAEQFEYENPAHLYSMGGAIQNNYMVALSLNSGEDRTVRIAHLDAKEKFEFDIDDIKALQSVAAEERNAGDAPDMCEVPVWARHTLGVLNQAIERGYPLKGMNMVLTSNVPFGGGLSNSAANCCAIVKALDDAYGLKLSLLDMARLAQAGEHDAFVGGSCGLLDQLLSLASKEGYLTMIDYGALIKDPANAIKHFKSNLPRNFQRVLINTEVPHDLQATEYGDRGKELSLAFQALGKVLGRDISSTSLTLRDLNGLILKLDHNAPQVSLGEAGLMGMISRQDVEYQDNFSLSDDQFDGVIDYVENEYTVPYSDAAPGVFIRHKGKTKQESFAILLRRMRHQLTSSLRTPLTGKAAQEGRIEEFGALINGEGNSLRESGDMQVTGKNGAQDTLLDIGIRLGADMGMDVFGRMEGGGGGGFVGFYINKLNDDLYEAWIHRVKHDYVKWAKQNLKRELNPTVIEPELAAGATSEVIASSSPIADKGLALIFDRALRQEIAERGYEIRRNDNDLLVSSDYLKEAFGNDLRIMQKKYNAFRAFKDGRKIIFHLGYEKDHIFVNNYDEVLELTTEAFVIDLDQGRPMVRSTFSLPLVSSPLVNFKLSENADMAVFVKNDHSFRKTTLLEAVSTALNNLAENPEVEVNNPVWLDLGKPEEFSNEEIRLSCLLERGKQNTEGAITYTLTGSILEWGENNADDPKELGSLSATITYIDPGDLPMRLQRYADEIRNKNLSEYQRIMAISRLITSGDFNSLKKLAPVLKDVINDDKSPYYLRSKAIEGLRDAGDFKTLKEIRDNWDHSEAYIALHGELLKAIEKENIAASSPVNEVKTLNGLKALIDSYFTNKRSFTNDTALNYAPRDLEAVTVLASSVTDKDIPLLDEFLRENLQADISKLSAGQVYDLIYQGMFGIMLAKEEKLNALKTNSGKPVLSASSPVDNKNVGGIDFRNIPLTIQPIGSFNNIVFQAPDAKALSDIDLDRELKQLAQMVEGGMLPSSQRVKEFIYACYYKNELSSRRGDLVNCLTDICRLQEEQGALSEPELKESLMLIEVIR